MIDANFSYEGRFIKIIGNHKRKRNQRNTEKEYTADFVTEISKFFISWGTNNEINTYLKDSSLLNIYNPNFPENFPGDWVYNIFEKGENQIIVTHGKGIKIAKIGTDNNNSAVKKKYIIHITK